MRPLVENHPFHDPAHPRKVQVGRAARWEWGPGVLYPTERGCCLAWDHPWRGRSSR